MTDPSVEQALHDLRTDPVNKDVPEEFWKKLATELSDSRLYYTGIYRSPNYSEAISFAKDILKRRLK